MNNKKIKENNLAFVDGQNLYMGTNSDKPSWHIDLRKFRIYLRDKYKVSEAFYFLGFVNDNNEELYDEIQGAGFILKFREHNSVMQGKKKGNVDSDIIFSVMKKNIKKKCLIKLF
jgi:phage anti-repressor protein